MQERLENTGINFPLFVCGVWRSGNHLLRHIIKKWTEIIPDYEGDNYVSLTGKCIRIDVHNNTAWFSDSLKRGIGKQIAMHAPYSDELFESIKKNNGKIIYIHRDKFDQLASFILYTRQPPEFCLFHMVSVWIQMKGWLEKSDAIIKYENLNDIDELNNMFMSLKIPIISNEIDWDVKPRIGHGKKILRELGILRLAENAFMQL